MRDRVFVVTGASMGIGLEAARALTAAGGKVALLARSGDALAASTSELKDSYSVTVDVTDLDGVSPGDEVVILGTQGRESWQTIDAREMAAAVGMIPWEVLCRLGTRIERSYAGSDDRATEAEGHRGSG